MDNVKEAVKIKPEEVVFSFIDLYAGIFVHWRQ